MERVAAQLQTTLTSGGVNRWFGELVTEPRYEQQQDEQELVQARAQLLDCNVAVELNPAAKLAWQQEPVGIAVYANGQYRLFGQAILSILEKLCGQWRLEASALSEAMACKQGAQLLNYLLDCGCIYVEETLE